MPIHLRAEPGDYAPAVLIPGDPRRAEYVARTFFEGAKRVNEERGMLGFTGTFEGKPISVQATGMGCPSAAIVAISATPADSTATHLVGGEPHAPTADFELVHAAVHVARHAGQPVRVGPVVSSDVFYDHDPERPARWRARGMLGVEMEAAVVFTLGALRGLSTGCLLVVSDLIIGEFVRIPDEELRAAVDRMTELAIRAALSEPKG
jgi:purine-nucleoside phosphorylase